MTIQFKLIRRITLLVLLALFLDQENVIGQSKKTHYFKNSIEIYFTPSLTKTNLDRKKVGASGWFKTLAEIEGQTNPVFGFNTGIKYSRAISRKFQVTLGIGYEEKGEISDKIAIHNSGNPNSENVLVQYKYKLQSYQMIIGLSHLGHEMEILRKKCKIIYGFNAIMDVYGKFTAQDYLNFKDSGKRRKGGITEMLLYYSSPSENAINHTKEGFIRLGVGVNYGIQYPFGKRAYCRVLGQLNYYTSPIEKHTFLIPGDALLLGITISPGISF
jgi:hypothetical protein